MVWKADEDLDEDKKQQEAGTIASGQILSSPSAGGSSGQAAAGTTAKDKTSSGSFTNLQDYIGANTGADKHMVGRVGNTVSNAQGAATGAGNTLEGKATGLIDEGTVVDNIGATDAFNNVNVAAKAPIAPPPQNTRIQEVPPPAAAVPPVAPGFAGRPPKAVGATPPTTPVAPGVGRAPEASSTPFVPTAAPLPPGVKSVNDYTVEDIDPLWNATYTGPNSWDDTPLSAEADAASKAYAKVAKYGERAGGDISDRGVLLDDTFATGGQQYGKGERMLDSYLLGAGSEAGTLQGIADTASGHGAEFDAIKRYIGDNNTAGSLVDTGIKTTKKTKDDIRAAGAGGQERLETEFGDITEAGGVLEKKVQQEEAFIKAAREGDKDALARFGLTNVAIEAAIKEMKKGTLDISNFIDGTVDYKLGDFAAEPDVGTYSQLMKLVKGSDKEGTVKQGFTDFTKGKGTTLNTAEGTSDALAGLSKLHKKQDSLAGQNKAIEEQNTFVHTVLSQIGNFVPPSDEQLKEVAGILNTNVEWLLLARDRGEPLDLNKILKNKSSLNLGDVTTSDEQTNFNQILAFLRMGGQNFDKATPTAGSLDVTDSAFAKPTPKLVASKGTLGPMGGDGGLLGQAIQGAGKHMTDPLEQTNQHGKKAASKNPFSKKNNKIKI